MNVRVDSVRIHRRNPYIVSIQFAYLHSDVNASHEPATTIAIAIAATGRHQTKNHSQYLCVVVVAYISRHLTQRKERIVSTHTHTRIEESISLYIVRVRVCVYSMDESALRRENKEATERAPRIKMCTK